MKTLNRRWVVGTIAVLILASFFFNKSFKDTLQRSRSIQRTIAESQAVGQEIQHLQNQLARLKKDPTYMEHLVRRDLGYLKSGEREIRFNKD